MTSPHASWPTGKLLAGHDMVKAEQLGKPADRFTTARAIDVANGNGVGSALLSGAISLGYWHLALKALSADASHL